MSNDAEELLRWGRSLIAAKRSPAASTTSPRSSVPLSNNNGGSLLRLSAANATVQDRPFERNDDLNVSEDYDMASASRLPSPVVGPFKTDEERHGVPSAVEADEPHYLRRDRVLRSLTASPGTSQPTSPTAQRTHHSQQPAAITGPRPRSHSSNLSLIAASQDPDTVNVVQLQQQREMLRRKMDSERQRVEDLKAMSDRNQMEFQRREAELLGELEAIPALLEASRARRSLRLAKENKMVQDSDLKGLEEILWTLENRIHEAVDEERVIGKELASCAEAVALGPSVASQCVDWLVSECDQVVALAQWVTSDVQSRVMSGPSAVDLSAPDDTMSLTNSALDMHTVTDRIQEALRSLAALRQPLEPYTEASSTDDAQLDALRAFREAGRVHSHVLTPLLAQVTDFYAALQEIHLLRLSRLQRAIDDKEVETRLQRAAMGEAHETLSLLMREKESLLARQEATIRKIDLATTAAEAEAKGHVQSTEAIETLLKQRSQATTELEVLTTSLRNSKHAADSAEREKLKLQQTTSAKLSRCEELREQARVLSADVEALSHELHLQHRNQRSRETDCDLKLREVRAAESRLAQVKAEGSQLQADIVSLEARIEAATVESQKQQQLLHQRRREFSESERRTVQLTDNLSRGHDELSQCTEDMAKCLEHVATLDMELRVQQERRDDAEEELEVARFVLLHRDADQTAWNANSRSSSTASNIAGARLSDHDQQLLFSQPQIVASSLPRSPLARKPTAAAVDSDRPPAAPTVVSAPMNTASMHIKNPEGRSRQWGRSLSSSADDAYPSATTTEIRPPLELEEASAPDGWRARSPPFIPLVVQPQPRNFLRDFQELTDAHEELLTSDASRRQASLASYLSDAMDDTAEAAGASVTVAKQPPLVTATSRAEVRLPSGVPHTMQWPRGADIAEDDGPMPARLMDGRRSTSQDSWGDRGRSMPRTPRATLNPPVQHQRSSDWLSARHAVVEPPFMSEVAPGRIQRPFVNVSAPSAAEAMRGPHQELSVAAPQQPSPAAPILRDRLTAVKAKLHRAVADHNTPAAQRRPFR